MLPERLWKPGGYGHHAVAVLESTYSGLWHPHRIVSTIAVSILTNYHWDAIEAHFLCRCLVC
jgi:hypothetical protein